VREQVQRHSKRKWMGLLTPATFAAPQLTGDTDGTEGRPPQNDYSTYSFSAE
jgi:hypothetical protein